MIGRDSYSLSDLPDHVVVGKFTSIAGGVKFHGKDEHPSILNPYVVSNYPFRERWECTEYPISGSNYKIIIGSDVWICEGVRILNGVTIGDGAIVGAGSVVTKDVEPYSLVAGNPAKFKRWRFPFEQIIALKKIAWWNWDNVKIRQNMDLMTDVNRFIAEHYDK